jgi:hypothetical protein
VVEYSGVSKCRYAPPRRGETLRVATNKKADVAEYPKVFHHVGLLVNEPPGMAKLLFI